MTEGLKWSCYRVKRLPLSCGMRRAGSKKLSSKMKPLRALEKDRLDSKELESMMKKKISSSSSPVREISEASKMTLVNIVILDPDITWLSLSSNKPTIIPRIPMIIYAPDRTEEETPPSKMNNPIVATIRKARTRSTNCDELIALKGSWKIPRSIFMLHII